MDCLKCGAPNLDDAACCSLCFAFFKKSEAAGPADRRKPLVAQRVAARLGDWIFTGPMVADPEALYFFVEKAERSPSPVMKFWAMVLGQSAGLVGGVLVDHVFDQAFERGGRPTGMRFGDPLDILPVYALCPMGLDARRCSEYFAVPRADVLSAEVPEDDQLFVSGAGFALTVEGPVGGQVLSGTLRTWGYPVGVGAQAPLLRKGLKLLAPLVAIGSFAAIFSEVYEVHGLATLPVVQKWLMGHEGRLSISAQYLAVGVVVSLLMYLTFKAYRPD